MDVCESRPAFSSLCSVTSLQRQGPVLLPPPTPLTPDPRQAHQTPQEGLFICLCVHVCVQDDDGALTLSAQCQSPAATFALEPRM